MIFQSQFRSPPKTGRGLNLTPPPQEQDETTTMLADFIDCPPDDEKTPEPPL